MGTPSDDGTLAALVARAEAGDAESRSALFAALHRLAEVQLRKSSGALTLSATTLLHEAYLELSKRDAWRSPIASAFSATRRAPCEDW